MRWLVCQVVFDVTATTVDVELGISRIPFLEEGGLVVLGWL